MIQLNASAFKQVLVKAYKATALWMSQTCDVVGVAPRRGATSLTRSAILKEVLCDI